MDYDIVIRNGTIIDGTGAEGFTGDVAISDDKARFVSCGGDKAAFAWDVATGQVIRKLEGHTQRLNAVCLCGPGASLALTGSYDASVRSSHDKRRVITPGLPTFCQLRYSATLCQSMYGLQSALKT